MCDAGLIMRDKRKEHVHRVHKMFNLRICLAGETAHIKWCGCSGFIKWTLLFSVFYSFVRLALRPLFRSPHCLIVYRDIQCLQSNSLSSEMDIVFAINGELAQIHELQHTEQGAVLSLKFDFYSQQFKLHLSAHTHTHIFSHNPNNFFCNSSVFVWVLCQQVSHPLISLINNGGDAFEWAIRHFSRLVI